jgi:DNA-directed RNA polymerase subunit RPC12/RpoP
MIKMSKIKCNKCGATIKIKTMFLENAGCENCGNRIDFTTMDSLSGLKQGLMLATAIIVGIGIFAALIVFDVSLKELPYLIKDMSIQSFGAILILAMLIVVIVGSLERVIGCSIYEKERKRNEELEKKAAEKRMQEEMN